jgi:hypothetical protein
MLGMFIAARTLSRIFGAESRKETPALVAQTAQLDNLATLMPVSAKSASCAAGKGSCGTSGGCGLMKSVFNDLTGGFGGCQPGSVAFRAVTSLLPESVRDPLRAMADNSPIKMAPIMMAGRGVANFAQNAMDMVSSAFSSDRPAAPATLYAEAPAFQVTQVANYQPRPSIFGARS